MEVHSGDLGEVEVDLVDGLVEGVFVGEDDGDQEKFAGVGGVQGFLGEDEVLGEDADGVDDDERAGGVVQVGDDVGVEEELGLETELLSGLNLGIQGVFEVHFEGYFSFQHQRFP